MPSTPANRKTEVWPRDWSAYFIETAAIVLLNMVSLSLQHGRLDYGILFSPQLGLRIFGSLCLWFANKFILEYILQSRIDANKVTQYLPFELTIASISVTSVIYLLFYPIFIYLNYLSFDWAKFFQGLFTTCGLSLFIVIFYAGNQIWQSWWSDGEFLFSPRNASSTNTETIDNITIKNVKGAVNFKLQDVLYFISESKITFLVDASGKKWITQYNLSELEEILGDQYFRLNRGILVSRQVISQIKKLPNHRLLVTIGPPEDSRSETISRYKSTRFKQWLDNSPLND